MGSVIGAFYELFLWNFKKTSTVSYGTAIGNLCPRAEVSFGVGAQYSVRAGTLVKNAARYPAFFGNHCLYSLLVLRNKKKYYLDVHRQMELTSSRVLSSVEAVQKKVYSSNC